jgi:hypothetical protein
MVVALVNEEFTFVGRVSICSWEEYEENIYRTFPRDVLAYDFAFF